MKNGYPAHGIHCAVRRGQVWSGWHRRLAVIAIVGLLVGMSAGVAPTPGAAQTVATVDADQLNLRAEPGTWSWVMAQLGYGDAVSLLAGPTEDGWYQVQAGEQIGWAHGWFLLVEGSPAANPPAESGAPVAASDGAAAAPAGTGGVGATAWVTTNALNLRAEPGDSAAILDVVGPGDEVTVVGSEVGGYVPVSHWSGQAWVWNGYLSYSAPAAGQERWADVDRSTNMVTLYEGDRSIASYWGAMGSDQTESGFYATAVGTYWVYEKYEDLSWTVYGQAWVRNWVAFDPNRLNGFHSFSMDQYGQVLPGGDGFTGGCIALSEGAAEHVFQFLNLGSRVVVHW